MTDQPALLDEEVIGDLRASVGGDDAFVVELTTTYLAEGAEQVRQIEAAAATEDMESIVRPAHSLKSSSASLGAARIAQVSRELELAAREGRADALADLVPALRAAWDETVEELRARGLTR